MVQKCSMVIPELTATLKEKKFLTPEVMFLSFQVPASFSFQAGQYVIIRMEKEGSYRLKSYSILNPPQEKGKIDLAVSIISGGYASELFKAIPLGHAFTVRGPVGHFFFDQESKNQEHWFVGVGTGLTPLYSMMKEHLPKYPHQKFVLLFGEKTSRDLLFQHEFKAWEEHPHFVYLPVLSREAWAGKRGRVQLHLPAEVQGKTFYVCGLKEMVLETKEALLHRGVLPENIKMERYT